MAFMFEKLEVYQNAVSLADAVAALTQDFPRGFGFLADQLNRAALSIATNLAEGNGRFTKPVVGHRPLPNLIQEWRQPQHEEFKAEKNGWSLWNAFRSVLRTKQETQPASVTTGRNVRRRRRRGCRR